MRVRTFPPSTTETSLSMRQAASSLVALALALVAAMTGAPAAKAQASWIDEGKLGLLAHDMPIGVHRVEHGVDFNGEVLFASPGFLRSILAPRPHLGVSLNSVGATDIAYFGLTWTADIRSNLLKPQDGVYAALGLGGAVHDGPNENAGPERLGLGTRLLFHESVELGYRLSPRTNVSLYLDHVSNADLGRHNPGLTNLGLRTGFKF